MNTKDIERRRFTRIHFDARTEIQKGDQKMEVSLTDISFNGIMVKSDTPLDLKIKDQVQVLVHLLGDDIIIQTDATLTHKRDNTYGFVIENMEIESLTQLRRLVELNLGDSKLLERELEHFFDD